MYKLATFQYSDVIKDAPHEKKFSGTITAAPSKGQKSNPMKHADVPVEVKKPLRKKNSRELGRLVERAGGTTAPAAKKYVAVLEERGVNPNLAKENVQMAKMVSNDMYKKAMYTAFSDELDKLAEFSQGVQDKATNYGATSIGPVGVGAIGGAGLGAVAGGAVGAAAGKGTGAGARALSTLKGTGVGSLIGGAIGAGLAYKQMKANKVSPGFDQAATSSISRKND